MLQAGRPTKRAQQGSAGQTALPQQGVFATAISSHDPSRSLKMTLSSVLRLERLYLAPQFLQRQAVLGGLGRFPSARFPENPRVQGFSLVQQYT